jgi:hypothetical protein
MVERASWIFVLAAALGAAASQAAPVLDDGPQGMTCYYYVASAELPWQRNGADWHDADGVLHGPRPFSTTPSGTGRQLRLLQWDVTALARAWTAGSPTAGAVMLRDVRGESGGSIVSLRSREHAASETHPELLLVWEDGRRERLKPRADTSFSCPTHKSSGSAPAMKVGGAQAAALVFQWTPPPPGARLLSARLELTADQTYGRGLDVGTFLPWLPSSSPSQVRTGLAAAFERDKQIASHPDVLFADDFDRGRRAAAWSGSEMTDSRTVADDATEGFAPLVGRALKVIIPRGQNEGLNSHYRFERQGQAEPDEAFFRYYLRLGESWNPVRDGGKLPGLSGTYGRGGWGMRRSDGHNGWSARGAFFRQPPEGDANAALRGIGTYAYHPDLEGTSGTTWGWGLGVTGLLEKHRWYSVEQQVKLNRPAQSDGELRAWINGELVFERTNLRFRDTAALHVESVWMNVYHGGTAKAAADMVLYIDNLVIARRYIGPMGGRR